MCKRLDRLATLLGILSWNAIQLIPMPRLGLDIGTVHKKRRIDIESSPVDWVFLCRAGIYYIVRR